MSVRRIGSFVLLFMLVMPLRASAQAEDVVELDIYFYDWTTRLRAQMTPENVRSQYRVRMVIRDEKKIAEVLGSLPISRIQELDTSMENQDVRLVVDCVGANGDRQTFFASQFFLFHSDFKNAAQLDPMFSQTFDLKVIFPIR